eukprot:scaffold25948_cov117-Cylindrotheca_fusiformis.AAC.1
MSGNNRRSPDDINEIRQNAIALRSHGSLVTIAGTTSKLSPSIRNLQQHRDLSTGRKKTDILTPVYQCGRNQLARMGQYARCKYRWQR